MIWRFRSEWDAISKSKSPLDIRHNEQKRAMHGPSSALGKRYLVSRTFLRNTLSRILDCPPIEIKLRDNAEGELQLLTPSSTPELPIRIAYAGIWVLLGISLSKLGVSTALPHFHPSHSEPTDAAPYQADATQTSPAFDHLEEVRNRTLRESVIQLIGDESANRYPTLISQNGAALTAEANDGKYIHIVDLPMPGQICAAIATYKPLSTIQAFGWRGQ
ncbi:hypothetical protein [Caballeronia sordidicola]|nr:hypothetical protein [Caballeronia sordidicola]